MKKLPNGVLTVADTQGNIFTVKIDKLTTTDNMIVYFDLVPNDCDLQTESTSVDILNETLIQVLESEQYTILA